MAIPAGVIFMHPGSNATVAALSGWDRVTSLDGRFVKGAAASTEADVTGGATTHTHTSPTHTHSIASHTHTGNSNLGVTGNTSGMYSAEEGYEVMIQADIVSPHTHTMPDSGSTAGTSGSTVATFATASSLPPYVEVIFIASDGSPLGVPVGAWAWWNADPAPTGWTRPAAAKNAYLKGAAAAGDGGATGGSATHAHTGVSHTHTSGHTHTGGTTGAATSTGNNAQVDNRGTDGAQTTHTHSAIFSDWVSAAATSADTGTGNGEPPYTKLAVIQNDNASVDLPTGTIGATLALLSAIPAGWYLCNGTSGTPDLRGSFIKGADALSELLDTGGAAGHDHTDPAGHTHSNHTHLTETSGISSGPYAGYAAPSGSPFPRQTHHHNALSSATGELTSTVQTVDTTADTQPPFRTVQFIMYGGNYTVTNDTPASAGTVSQPGFTFEWTNTTGDATYTAPQNDYRVEVFSDSGGVTTVYDSGQVASAVEEHVNVPASWSGGRPVNATTYYWRVRTHDSLGIEGLSAITAFTTSWTPPDPITGLTVTPSGNA